MCNSDTKTVRTLVIKFLVCVALPAAVFAAAVILMDPYNFFGYSNLVEKGRKLETSRLLAPCLWKSFEYRRMPAADHILLGDSRMDNMEVDRINDLTGERWHNLAYTGASLPEMFDTFWHAASRTRLKQVAFGINFNQFNGYFTRNRFREADAIMRNPALYFVNGNVIESCYLILYSRLSGRGVSLGKPDMDPEAFWAYQLTTTAKGYYWIYTRPAGFVKELEKISAYCRANAVKVTFIIFPTHTDLQRRVRDYGLEEEERAFRNELGRLGAVYDFDYANAFTADRANFSDPFHYKNSRPIIDEVWGNGKRYARTYGPEL